ncbi:MAG TPA: hypothetical protein VKY89_23220 [Thermoanaerobaculia bacterium]|jgi:hypothetical protein|nr:hypothetical protein [Thermoanaerobaculia bacterium]
MSRRSWKRTVAVLLVVAVCALAVPAHATSATAPSMDSVFYPAGWLWTKGMDLLRGIWVSLHAGRGAFKFGAGHSSDGHALSKSAD